MTVRRQEPEDRASSLIAPYGGALADCVATGIEATQLEERARLLPSIELDPLELLDLELIGSGGASPVRGFLRHEDHRSVLERRTLRSGTLFPLPLTIAVPLERIGSFRDGDEVALRTPLGAIRGVLTVRDAFVRDRGAEAHALHGTDDPSHPGARSLLVRPSGTLGGEIRLLRPPGRRFETAREVRLRLASAGHLRVAAGLGSGVLEAAATAAPHADAVLSPFVTGEAGAGSPLPLISANVPLPRRRAGAREALLRAIVLRNFGASHLVLGASRIDLKTADALFRHRAQLGMQFLLCDGSTGPRASARFAA